MMEYWENRYLNGGNSGKGSTGLLKLAKWWWMSKYFSIRDASVADVGCGDMSFWRRMYVPREKYTGIDISQTVIDANVLRYPESTFIVSDASVRQPIKADVVLCLDVLFHITDDDVYGKILDNLTTYANNWIFIYTWIDNPFDEPTHTCDGDGKYQKYREFDRYIDRICESGFFLVDVHYNRWIDKYGGMYVFKKKTGSVKK